MVSGDVHWASVTSALGETHAAQKGRKDRGDGWKVYV